MDKELYGLLDTTIEKELEVCGDPVVMGLLTGENPPKNLARLAHAAANAVEIPHLQPEMHAIIAKAIIIGYRVGVAAEEIKRLNDIYKGDLPDA